MSLTIWAKLETYKPAAMEKRKIIAFDFSRSFHWTCLCYAFPIHEYQPCGDASSKAKEDGKKENNYWLRHCWLE